MMDCIVKERRERLQSVREFTVVVINRKWKDDECRKLAEARLGDCYGSREHPNIAIITGTVSPKAIRELFGLQEPTRWQAFLKKLPWTKEELSRSWDMGPMTIRHATLDKLPFKPEDRP